MTEVQAERIIKNLEHIRGSLSHIIFVISGGLILASVVVMFR